MKRVFYWIWLLPRNTAILLMKIYRKVVSPWYGDVCRYYPSCSRYALDSYKSVGFIKGTVLTAWRLLRCNPWSPGGIDDAKEPNNNNLKENRFGFIVLNDASNVIDTDKNLENSGEDQKTKGGCAA